MKDKLHISVSVPSTLNRGGCSALGQEARRPGTFLGSPPKASITGYLQMPTCQTLLSGAEDPYVLSSETSLETLKYFSGHVEAHRAPLREAWVGGSVGRTAVTVGRRAPLTLPRASGNPVTSEQNLWRLYQLLLPPLLYNSRGQGL